MKTGIVEMKHDLRWRGRRYWGGILGGIAIGCLVGYGLGIKFGYHRAVVPAAIVLSVIGAFVRGSPPKAQEQQSHDRQPVDSR